MTWRISIVIGYEYHRESILSLQHVETVALPFKFPTIIIFSENWKVSLLRMLFELFLTPSEAYLCKKRKKKAQNG